MQFVKIKTPHYYLYFIVSDFFLRLNNELLQLCNLRRFFFVVVEDYCRIIDSVKVKLRIC